MRILPQDEWLKLEPIIKAEGGTMPGMLSTVIVEEDGQEIIGFAILRLVPHAGFWVHPEHRGTRMLINLAVEARGQLQGAPAYVTCVNPDAARWAEALGLEKVEAPIYHQPGEVLL